MKIKWKLDFFELTIKNNRFKFPLGVKNLKRKSIFYHINNFQFPDVNLFEIDLNGYFQKYRPGKGNVILDAGAYSGIFSIYVATKIKNTGKIIAFEPNRDSILQLKRAIELNNLTNVEVVKKGVWNKQDTLNFIDRGVCSEITAEKGDYSIEVTDLDSQIKKLKIKPEEISFIKMDIEGAELEAIDGMEDILKNGTPEIAIASYHIVNGEKTCFEVEKKLKRFGFRTSTRYPRHLTTYAKK